MQKTFCKQTTNLSFLLLLLLVACSKSVATTSPPTPVSDPTNIPTGDQPTTTQDFSDLTVVLGYEGQAEYIAAARANPDSDLELLYQKHAVEPYWQQCAAGGEYVALAEGAVNPIHDLVQLEQMIQVLQNSEIETQIEEAYARANQLLPSGSTTICVFAQDPVNTFIRDRMNGVGGLTAGAGKIWLQAYPEGNWEEWINYTLAHEFHHSVWTEQHYDENEPFHLIDYLVFEGRADAFARQLYPELTAPWTDALGAEEEIIQWETIQKILKATSYQTQRDYMFGNQGRDIPLWTGYTIGFHIVQEFIETHPEVSVEEWTAMEAMDILEQSGYGTEQ